MTGGIAGGAALLGLRDLPFLSSLPAVTAAEAELPADSVRFDPEIEPLVRLIEDTPRAELLEKVAAHLRRGVSYREILAALLLAGIRNVQPRPNVGFKFHAVLVVNSAHLASQSSPAAERWLPIFWALDYFKSSQAQEVEEGNWTMGRVKEADVPPPDKARAAFAEAMDRWDESAADAAVAGLARSAGAGEVYEMFWRYGMRDFRSIGHKAIYVANSWRTLGCIGWHHAEPVVRSLAYALLMHVDGNPADRDDNADRPWRRNVKLVGEIRADWRAGKPDPKAADELLAALRQGSDEDASRKVVELLHRGVSPQSLWDALFCAAGEMLLAQPGIVSLHAATTANALHHAYLVSAVDETRRLALLQCAAFLTMFREAMKGRGAVNPARIDQLGPVALGRSEPGQAIEEIFADVSADRPRAIGKALSYLEKGGPPKDLIDAARVLVFLKGNDAHDYKFSSAVLEDFLHVTPAWRNRFLASSLVLLPGSGDRDNQLVQRTRAAFEGTRVF